MPKLLTLIIIFILEGLPSGQAFSSSKQFLVFSPLSFMRYGKKVYFWKDKLVVAPGLCLSKGDVVRKNVLYF